jgi:hypothetical protein
MRSRLFIIITLFLLAASAAFADNFAPSIVTLDRVDLYNLDVTVDTSGLGTGYLYFQYGPNGPAAPSTATLQGFVTDGALGLRDTSGEINGVGSSYELPGSVVFDSPSSGLFADFSDLNQFITFGNSIAFHVLFADGIGPLGGASTFSMGLYEDALGATPLVTNDGFLFAEDYANVPEPSTLLLIGPALLGVFGLRKRFAK